MQKYPKQTIHLKDKANLYFFTKQLLFFNHIHLIFYKNFLISTIEETSLFQFLSKGNRSYERLSESFFSFFFKNKNRISQIGQRNVAHLTIPTPFPFYPIAREILGEAEFLSRNFDNCILYRCTQLEITIWRNILNVRRRRGSASLLLLALAIIDWCLFWIRFLLLNSRVIRENGELKS